MEPGMYRRPMPMQMPMMAEGGGGSSHGTSIMLGLVFLLVIAGIIVGGIFYMRSKSDKKDHKNFWCKLTPTSKRCKKGKSEPNSTSSECTSKSKSAKKSTTRKKSCKGKKSSSKGKGK